MASAAARERYARKNEAADLKRAFNALDSKGDGKIDPEELNQVFLTLGHKPRRGEVEDLIWEVDEDCDGCISWQEFQRMYHRCRQDSTGARAVKGSRWIRCTVNCQSARLLAVLRCCAEHAACCNSSS